VVNSLNLNQCEKHAPCLVLACWLTLVGAFPQHVAAASAVFGGGPFYSGGTAVMNTLRASGFTTVMLWSIHVDSATGNLILNDQLVASNGAYVGNASWPGQLATLKTTPTSVNRIEVSIGSYGVNDFLSIQTLMNSQGTNTSSVLYQNFLALKNATGATAADFDDETLYDVPTTVKFGQMLSSIGYKVTLCPYTNPTFWQNVYNQLGSSIVDAVYLQCYAGGAGNNPSTWNSYFGGLKVSPGLWCSHGTGCASGDNPASVASKMLAWKSSASIPGGFMWLYDDMQSCSSQGTPANYAYAINQAVDPLQISPSAGFSAVTAYNTQFLPASTPFTLTNSGAATLNWSLANTSLWLNISTASGSLAASASTTVTVSLNAANATNLPPGQYAATIWFSNLTTSVSWLRTFALDTAVANWPIPMSGFNAALLAGNTATPGAPGASAFDIPNNYCFYQAGLPASTRGLPFTGNFASLLDSATAFQLGPYGGTNALLLGYNYPKFGTLTLSAPQGFSALAILASSANGGGLGTLVLNFTNGAKSPVLYFNAQDWFYNVTNVALQGFGRLKLGASFTIEDNGASNPNLYQTTLNLAVIGLSQPISSITFSNPASAGAQQNTAIFAVSGMASTIPVAAPARLIAVPGTNATVSLSWSGSVGATNYHLKRSIAGGGPYDVIASTSGTNYTNTGLANGTRYYFVVSAIGVSGEGANSVEVSDTPGSYQSWTLASSPSAYWPLNETNCATAFDLVSGNNGSYSGGYTLATNGPAGGGFGSPHRAAHYNGSTAYTQLPVVIGSTNFTILLWVQTTDTGGTVNWYNGKGLLDGEVGGTVNDFGTALVGTRAAFGIGNPDTTLTSVKRINDGLWHQVVCTRDAGSGAMQIYIDGAFDASTTGPAGTRTAPPNLRLASIQTGAGGGFLAGNICDVAVYNRALTSNQISTLYRAASGLFYNVTLTNSWNGTNLVLSWPGCGQLQEATTLPGPWATNSATSPVTVTPVAAQKFFRIQTQ